jgi:peptidoglycan hydrolase CwlO-like protein
VLYVDYNTEIFRLDTENKQLHQVIAQLRQARKLGKEDIDAITNERDELRSKSSSQLAEIDRLVKVY